MLDIARIKSTLYGLVGWKEPVQSDYAIITAANQVSRSGKFFQQYSKALRIENLRNSAPQLSEADFNLWLTDKTEQGIVNAAQSAVGQERDLLESKVLFHFENDFLNKISNTANNFVGYQFSLEKSEGIALKINKIMTQFDGVATFDIYIYHSSQQTAIKTISVTTQADSVKTQSDGTVLYYQNDTYVGGTFYIGYYQDDLGAVEAYDRQYESADIQNCFEHVYIRPISVTNIGTSIFDVNDVENQSETWGLNFDISVYNDYTQLMLDNESVITDLIGYEVAADMLDYIWYQHQNNNVSKELKDRIIVDLKGITGARTPGLEEKRDNERERVKQLLFPEHLLIAETIM